MTAPGFPSQNPARQGRGNVRSPINQGSLMEWMKWNFPSVYAKVSKNKRDTIKDYKSSDYAKQHPTQSGRTP